MRKLLVWNISAMQKTAIMPVPRKKMVMAMAAPGTSISPSIMAMDCMI